MKKYYIDNVCGNDENDGLTESTPKKDYKKLCLCAGDCVAFRCGNFYREQLEITGGEDGAPIIYSSYGKGEKPIFCGSINVSNEDFWEDMGGNIWRLGCPINGDVGNFVLDGECCATFRYSRDELVSQADFWDSRQSEGNKGKNFSPQEIFFYSDKNPAKKYNSIECVSYGTRVLVVLKSNVIIENLSFMNSGVHALAGSGKNITVRGCDFKNIGGCAWDRELKIRFGNGIEFWQYGENITVENCGFKNIYDSCVTHQGPGENTVTARNFVCRNNRFDTYGMAAFEYRDKMPIDSCFSGNECVNAGCGFAMLGETVPRRSEIWPQPMGHHIFLWRIENESDGGSLLINNNRFLDAPVGAAIYSIISSKAEAQISLKDNVYEGEQAIRIYSKTLK